MGFVKKIVKKVDDNKKVTIIISIVVIALFVVLSRLPMFDSTFSRVWWLWDDCFYINVANNLLQGNGFNLSILEYRQVMIPVPGGGIGELTYNYGLWDWAGRPYYFSGPIYPLFLAMIYFISSASPTDWYLYGAIANFIIVTGIITIVYFAAVELFDRKVAILSVILISLLPYLYQFSMRVLPYPLLCLFILLAFVMAYRATRVRDWIWVGVFMALAHLTHPSGIVVVVTFITLCSVRRNYKGLLVLISVYLCVMSPWLIRNQIVFNDMMFGLAIPLASILSWFGVEHGLLGAKYVAIASKLSFNVFGVYSHMIDEFWNIYKMLGFVIAIIPLAIFGIYKYPQKKIIASVLIFLPISLLSYLWLSISSGTIAIETKHLLPFFILIIPFAMYGFLKYVAILATKFKKQEIKTWYIFNIVIIIGISVATIVAFNIYFHNEFNKPMALQPAEVQFHEWVRGQGIEEDAIIMSNSPHVLYLRTGLPSIYLWTNGFNIEETREVINKYGVKYLAIYVYDKHQRGVRNRLDTIEEEYGAIELFNNESVHFYRIGE